ncbi:hypothetical protein OSB04_019227 [Centaurea solstitialis]|uniref:Protein kinase domain-containing protein n=1 Tax=Centaurea solstitialis TaxID=347529 RepID=A0AA38SRJ7_9ASTR|nr:hypothetical protein OSB04_019227 [Centaurea solstitialis]
MSLYQEFDHLRIPLEDIKRATNNFAEENLIVNRDYGKVYKGELVRSEGLIMCAFKRVNRSFGHGYRDFMNEIGMLLKYRHDNIVSLVGFCNESDDQILVSEFLANGSLDQYLGSPKLTWSMRLEICLGVARGLTNLHCYVDPLDLDTGFLTKESDIHSFGVVLFEVLCGRLACTYEEDIIQFLSQVACHHYEKGTLSDIIDPILKKQMNPKSLSSFSAIAYDCLQGNRKERPTILEITKKLEQALALQHEFDKALLVEQLLLNTSPEPADFAVSNSTGRS